MTDQEQRELFSKNLQHYLDSRSKTRVDLADELGVSSATTSDWLNSKKMPRMGKISHIAQWLGINVSDLLENKGAYEDVDQFRQRMRDQYGVLFDMYDGASPEDRKKIEDMVKIIVRHDDDIDGA